MARQMGDLLAKKRQDTRLDGPIPLTGFNIGFQITEDGQQVISAPGPAMQGWQFARTNSRGNPLELIALEGDKVTYETTEYRRWSTFTKRFETVGQDLIALSTNSLDIDFISLEYLDRFNFVGDAAEASPVNLLTGIEGHLHGDALSGRTLWHLHRGWFEKRGAGDILVNQNLDAIDAVQQDANSLVRSLSIMTKAEVRSASYPVDDERMPEILDFLHNVTKYYFREILHPAFHQSVGLSEE
jgi:uncharacterized protein (TIGR04255 family)